MYIPQTETLKITYFLQGSEVLNHKICIKTFIPQVLASYIQYFWQQRFSFYCTHFLMGLLTLPVSCSLMIMFASSS